MNLDFENSLFSCEGLGLIVFWKSHRHRFVIARLHSYNAIFKATTVSSARGELRAVPYDELIRILEKHQALNWDVTVPR